MQPSSDSPGKHAALASELLGLNPNDSPDTEHLLSWEELQAAVEAAHERGVVEEHATHAANQTELYFWQLMDTLPDHVYFKDLQSRFICINRSQSRFLGLKEPSEAVGKTDFDFFPKKLAETQFADEQEIIRTGKGYSLHEERYSIDEEQRCLIASKQPLKDAKGSIVGTFGISRDITERYLAEKEVERQRNLLESIIRILPCQVFARDLDSNYILANHSYQRALGAEPGSSIIGKRFAELANADLYPKVQEDDRRIVEQGQPILNKVEHETDENGRRKWTVVSKVPLRSEDNKIDGLVGMVHDISKQKQAEETATQLSEALRKKNSELEAELLVARQLQEKLMSIGFDSNRRLSIGGPKLKLSASYYYKPSHHLAGDFFELIQISDTRVGILVCDVMGHGVKAALVTMLLRGLIAEFADFLDQPGKVLGTLNERLCSLAEGQEFPRFTTAVYLTLDLESGVARIANGGHPGPLWTSRNANGQPVFEASPAPDIGPALGLIPDLEYETKAFSCEGPTELLLYTDGIIEQTDAVGREFGIKRLEELLLQNREESLDAQLAKIKSALKSTAGTDSFDDDTCLVALRLDPTES